VLANITKDHTAFTFKVKQSDNFHEGSMILRNARKHVPSTVISHPRRLESSAAYFIKTYAVNDLYQMVHIIYQEYYHTYITSEQGSEYSDGQTSSVTMQQCSYEWVPPAV
jgi:hypothetical protein